MRSLRTAQALYDAVVARYASPATATLGQLLLPYLFPELSAFATVEDLVSHLRTSNARYRAAAPAEFLECNQPPMFITLYFIVTRLPDSLRSVRDHFLSVDPTALTVDLLEQNLHAAHGTLRTPFFEGCSPSPLAPSYASAATVDVTGAEDVGTASASAKRRSSKGKGGGGSGGDGGRGASRSGGGQVGATQRGGSGSGLRQQQQRPSETPSPQQLREWFSQRGASGGSGSCPYVIRTGDRAGQTCRKPQTQHRRFSRLNNTWRAEFGDEAERPRWAELLRSGVAIFDLDYDAILVAMYVLSVSAEGECYMCVPPNPGIEAGALGASECSLSGTAPAEALHTFTLDSGASRCFFRDSTTLTPLFAPVPVKLADPFGGPVLARSSTVLPCPAVPSGSLSGLHLPSFSTNLVNTAALQDVMVTTTLVTPPCHAFVACTPASLSLVFPGLCLPSRPRLPRPAFLASRGGIRLLLLERFRQDLPVLRLHSDRGGELSSDLLRDFCQGEGILQLFTLPDSPQQNKIAECCIGFVMEVARTSMIHAAAPHFRWTFAVRYAAHHLNLWPSVSLPETSPTPRWTGEVGDASVFRFYHPTSRPVFPSQEITFDESVPFYRLFPYRSAPPPPPPLFLAPDSLSGTVPVEVAIDSGAAQGAASRGAASRGAEPGGVEPGGPASASPRLSTRPEPFSPQLLREWCTQCTRLRSGATGAKNSAARDTRASGVEVTSGAGGPGGAAAAGPGGARTRGTGVAGTGSVGGAGARDSTEPGVAEAGDTGAGGAGARGAGAVGAKAGGTGAGGAGAGGAGAVNPGAGGAVSGGTRAGGTVWPRAYFILLLQQVLGVPSSPGLTPPLLCPPPDKSQPLLQPASALPTPSPYIEWTGGLTERREPASRPASLVCNGRHVPRPRPPPVPGTLAMALRHSCVPMRGPLPPPPESPLPAVPDPESDRARVASPTVSYYATALVAESESASPPSVGGEFALGSDVLEDTQEDFESHAAAVPRFASMLLAPDGDLDAPDIPTPRSYTEVIMALLRVALSGLSTAFLQGSLHEEIWLRHPPGFTESFPAGTQGSLRRPVYDLRQAPREWHDTLRTTLVALGFAPSTADPSLFLHTDTLLPPFYVLVYVDDLVFATADFEALTLVKSELQKRHTCTDLGELRSYLGL
ncbi:unnamed protein product [Closterium sp. NIES-53]